MLSVVGETPDDSRVTVSRRAGTLWAQQGTSGDNWSPATVVFRPTPEESWLRSSGEPGGVDATTAARRPSPKG
jgi:hypothetical protein